jgi:CBS domain-containing protein
VRGSRGPRASPWFLRGVCCATSGAYLASVRYFQQSLREYMSTPVCCVTDSSLLPDVYGELELHRVSAVPVVSAQGRVAGIVSRSDLLQVGAVRKGARWQRIVLDLPKQPVHDVMTRNPLCIDVSATVSAAVEMMLHERVHRLCVVQEQRLVGVFSTHDAMRALVDDRIPTPLVELMTKAVVTARAVDPVERALERLGTADVQALIVTEGNLPIGVFGQPQALLAQRSTAPSRVEDWADPRVLCLPGGFPAHRAAAQAVALHADHIVVLEDDSIAGIVTASDLARSGLSSERQDALRPRSGFR